LTARWPGRLAASCCAAAAVAFSGCGGPAPQQPLDAQLSQASSGARAAFDRGLLAEAVSLNEQALNRANLIDSQKDISEASYNLAACLIVLGQFGRADALLGDARIEAERAGLSTTDIVLLRAKVARLDGRAADASALADKVLSDPRSAASPGDRSAARVLKGELALARGDLAAARVELAAAEKEHIAGNPALMAGPAGLRAGIDLAAGAAAAAGAGFDRQADLLRQAKLYGEMVTALRRAGESYQAAGNAATAADRFFRAARSAAVQGDRAGALQFAQSAVELAGRAKDAALLQRSQRLLDSLR
jgi:hypothetical protein